MALIAKRNFGIIAAVTVVAGLGAAGIAAANAGGLSGSRADDDNEPKVVGTVKAPAESATEQDDSAEEAALGALAKVTPDEAKAAAATAAGGTATEVELEEEDGYVVYDVDVTTKAGITDVTVDAGTGKILAQEQEGPEDQGDDSQDDEHDD